VVLLLIEDRPPDPPPSPPPPRALPRLPWRPFAWLAAFGWLLVLAGALGGLAGYVVILAAFVLGCWRIEGWARRQNWVGLHEYRQ
jgi:hypothetical protein